MISPEQQIQEELNAYNNKLYSQKRQMNEKGELVMVYLAIASLTIMTLAVWKFIDIIIYVTNLATK